MLLFSTVFTLQIVPSSLGLVTPQSLPQRELFHNNNPRYQFPGVATIASHSWPLDAGLFDYSAHNPNKSPNCSIREVVPFTWLKQHSILCWLCAYREVNNGTRLQLINGQFSCTLTQSLNPRCQTYRIAEWALYLTVRGPDLRVRGSLWGRLP